MKREFKIINTFDEVGEKLLIHDYTIVMDDTKNETAFTLYRSNNSEWSSKCRGKKCFKIIDDGNGLIFPKKLSSKRLEYIEAAELLISLHFINKIDSSLYQGYYEEVITTKRIDI